MESRHKHAIAPHRSGWGRTARAVATFGAMAVAAALGLVGAAGTANATGGDPHQVWICHATSSDTNPYVAIFVDVASKKYEAHLEHKNNPNKSWKSDGTFQGAAHVAGDPKPDMIDVAGPEACFDTETPPSTPPAPPDEVSATIAEEATCADGYRETTTTVTKEYVWDGTAWVLEPEEDWETTVTSTDWQPLTTDQIEQLGCVLGTETVVPKPDESTSRPPTVLGTEAAVPSAVDAGLAGSSGDGGSSGPTALLVAGALTLLALAGGTAARTRKGGAHEA